MEGQFDQSLQYLWEKYDFLKYVVEDVLKNNGRIFLVGGTVRDMVLGLAPKDFDIEVHGISLNQLEDFLKKWGPVRLVGKAFGVLQIDGYEIDFSVARTDSSGRHPHVAFDPHISLKEAAARRDLTMNALFIDMHTGALKDPFNGLQDIKDKILRAPDVNLFVQDPLRFYRVVQFIGRFKMIPDKALSDVCASMDITLISKERIFQEFEKLFLLSEKPSLAFDWLEKIGRLQELLPELYALKGVKQNPEFHPEGDVFEHTMQAVDAAAQADYATNEKRFMLCLAALCHDLGKVTTSCVIDGRIRSHGHDVAGVPFAEQLVDRLTGKTFFKRPVTRLVRYHMMPYYLVTDKAGAGAYKRLARNLYPDTCMEDLSQLALFDKSARNPKRGEPLSESVYKKELQEFIDQVKKWGVWHGPELPILTGADLCSEGIMQGPEMGALLQRAYDLQIQDGIIDKDELKKRVLKK